MDQYRLWIKSLSQRGFTLIENILILVLIGVFTVIAAPNMSQMLAKIELNKSVVAVQTHFASAQREAIRTKEGCEVGLLENQDPANEENSLAPLVGYGECMPENFSALSEKAIVATNLTTPVPVTPNVPSEISKKTEVWCSQHEAKHKKWEEFCAQPQEISSNFAQMFYNLEGGATFRVLSTSKYPIDPTGKFVFYNPGNSDPHPPCLLISNRFGLVRKGSYSGSLDANAMTESGVCKTDDWEKQTL